MATATLAPSGWEVAFMLCPNCGRENPSEARFCMICATRLETPEPESLTDFTGSTSLLTESPSSSILVSADFVGRQQVIVELVSALDEASSGQGRLVMLVGEPGIGKTRTAQELVAIAEERGSRARPPPCLRLFFFRARSTRIRRMASAAAPKKWRRLSQCGAFSTSTSRRYTS